MRQFNIFWAYGLFLLGALGLPCVDYYFVSGGFGAVGKTGAILAAVIAVYFVVAAVANRNK